jgi:cytochrome c oxidase assembly protein subunit 15
MNLSDFKGIFWAEFIHRVFGRVLGLVFFIPFLLFCWKGVLPPKQRWIYLGIGLLGGAQGILGWWMVKSGLVDRPEVSAYRLCAHLMLASLLFWMCLLRVLIEGQTKWATSKLHLCCIFILFLQLSSGAFASGTEAGHVFFVVLTSFGAHVWLPELGIQNVFDNIFVIMFHHLSLAIVLTTFLLHYSYREWKRNNKTVIWIVLALGLQISLGLLTAWHYSPTRPLWLALSHQLGAFLLLTSLTLCAPKRDLSALG